MKPDLKVVPLPVIDLREIPANLRRLADDIEAGKLGDVSAAMVVVEPMDSSAPVICNYGYNLDALRSLGLLRLASDVMARNCLVQPDRDAKGG